MDNLLEVKVGDKIMLLLGTNSIKKKTFLRNGFFLTSMQIFMKIPQDLDTFLRF